MIVDTLKNIATQVLAMDFRYGTREILNLKDTSSEKYQFLLLPVENKPVFNEFNKVVANNYDIAVLIGKISPFDAGTSTENGEDYYEDIWNYDIRPLYDDGIVAQLMAAMTCDDMLTVSNTAVKEIIGLFDNNLAGLYITFQIKEDLI